MTRALTVTVAIACVLLGVRPTAQARPDLTGKWMLTDALDLGVFGQSFTATQSATVLTIESTNTSATKPEAAPAPASTPRTLAWTVSSSVAHLPRWTYSMTAEEKSETHPRPAWVDDPDQARKLWSYMESSTERAVWRGDLLLVVSHAYYRTHWPDHTPAEFPTETTVQLSISVDGANRLTVERVVIADPLPGNQNLRFDIPSVRRSVYTRVPGSNAGR
jgi:hypothetical protein